MPGLPATFLHHRDRLRDSLYHADLRPGTFSSPT